VHTWDAGKGTTLLSFNAHTAGVNVVRWSPDGKRLATAGADKSARIWFAG
jgi:WD40 repeat protein